MTTPADKSDEASAVDPGAIDLEAIKTELYRGNFSHLPTHALIAAVEALRERNTMLLRKMGERAKWASDANDRAEAAEARVVEMAGALDGLLDAVEAHNEANERVMVDPHSTEHARAALAATPAETLERARAVEAMRQFIDDFESQFVCWDMMNLREHDEAVQHFVERAAKLDALGKEKADL